MGFFDRIFRYGKSKVHMAKKNSVGTENTNFQNRNVIKLIELGSFIDFLMNADRYIAKSDYIAKIEEYSAIVNFFTVLESSGMLDEFCQRNTISLSEIQHVLDSYNDLEKRIDRHNEEFIAKAMVREKDYLDDILKGVDPVISLDEDQRRVVLTDEDYCLVIAGAGAGKATTVVAKVKYLVDKQEVKLSHLIL